MITEVYFHPVYNLLLDYASYYLLIFIVNDCFPSTGKSDAGVGGRRRQLGRGRRGGRGGSGPGRHDSGILILASGKEGK